MMGQKDHEFHKTNALALGELHKAAMDNCDPETEPRDYAFHKGAMELCQKVAGHHASRLEATQARKAAGFHDDEDRLEPLPAGLSILHGDTPVHKMVLRPGMREPERPQVDPQFEKLVAVDEDHLA